MLTISQVTKSFAGRVLFEDASLQVNRGDRIGLVGPNGAGKSTLFSLILGEASPDAGKCRWRSGSTSVTSRRKGARRRGDRPGAARMSHSGPEHRWEIEPKAKRILPASLFAKRFRAAASA